MRDIKLIPEVKLRADLKDSKQDIIACEKALRFGALMHNSRGIQSRLTDNERFVRLITAELHRRELLETE